MSLRGLGSRLVEPAEGSSSRDTKQRFIIWLRNEAEELTKHSSEDEIMKVIIREEARKLLAKAELREKELASSNSNWLLGILAGIALLLLPIGKKGSKK